MKNILAVLFLVAAASSFGEEDNRDLGLSCKDVAWGDVVELVQPYLDEALYVSLVMQGQSAEYHTSAAAREVINHPLPKTIQVLLQALIKAEC